MSEKELTKKIPLTQGQFSIVDAENYEWLLKWKWHASWNPYTKSYYAKRDLKRLKSGTRPHVYMAREILGLKKTDKRLSDHIDHNTLNNRLSNLRIVSPQQNTFNRRYVKGYTYRKDREKYISRITVNNKTIYLGYFDTLEEAREAYREAKGEYHQI